jgi:molybdenum cofactor cytidylyltransferase
VNSKDNNNSLAHSLDIQPGDVVAFVGAGGKTSLMLALAEELFDAGIKVAVTTTTKIGTHELPKNQPNELIVDADPKNLISNVRSAIAERKIPILASGIDESNDRLLGNNPATVDILAHEEKIDVLLIEADGARRKPFKIPMPHEPVVPDSVNKLCIVVGLDALNLKINEENFYNTTGMQELGAILGETLTPQLMRGLLLHQTGYLMLKTPNRKMYLVLNKVEKIKDDVELQELIIELFHNDIEKILVTTAINKPIIRKISDNRYHRLTGIILAAGMSSRFSGVKQLAKINDNSLIHHIVKQALESDLDDVKLILGHKFEEVKSSLKEFIDDEKLSIIHNKNFTDGMSSSIIIGLESALGYSDGVMIILGDQPNITTEILNKLIKAYKDSVAKLCLPMIITHNSARPGHPVIFNQRLFSELVKMIGDIGAREVVRKNLEYAKQVRFHSEETQFQINTVDDLKRYISYINENKKNN